MGGDVGEAPRGEDTDVGRLAIGAAGHVVEGTIVCSVQGSSGAVRGDTGVTSFCEDVARALDGRGGSCCGGAKHNESKNEQHAFTRCRCCCKGLLHKVAHPRTLR